MKNTLTKVVLATGFAAIVASSSVFAGEVMAPAPTKEVVVVEEVESWWSAELSIGYDSLYMFRGVQVTNDLVTADLSFSAYGFTAGAWYGGAYNANYNELDLYASYTASLGAVDLTGGYIYYDFPKTGGNTQEVFAAVSTSVIPFVTPSLSYYYDFDRFDGSYIELALASSIPVVEGVVSIDPFTSLSYDIGYNLPGNGFNNLEVGVAIPVVLSDVVTVSAYATYSWALNDLGDIQDDEIWGGAKVTFSF